MIEKLPASWKSGRSSEIDSGQLTFDNGQLTINNGQEYRSFCSANSKRKPKDSTGPLNFKLLNLEPFEVHYEP